MTMTKDASSNIVPTFHLPKHKTSNLKSSSRLLPSDTKSLTTLALESGQPHDLHRKDHGSIDPSQNISQSHRSILSSVQCQRRFSVHFHVLYHASTLSFPWRSPLTLEFFLEEHRLDNTTTMVSVRLLPCAGATISWAWTMYSMTAT